MPPYLSVECYVPCRRDTLGELVAKYSALLERLGYEDWAASQRWLTDMGWDHKGEWTGPPVHPLSSVHTVTVADKPLFASATVFGWSDEIIPDLRGRWVCFDLAFETESEDQYLVTASAFAPVLATYIPGVGSAIWHVMREFAGMFPDVPVFCTFEGWEGDAWKALETGKGNLWSFEAALLPAAFSTRFSPIPDTYVSEDVPEGIALARRDVWLMPPWKETVNIQ